MRIGFALALLFVTPACDRAGDGAADGARTDDAAPAARDAAPDAPAARDAAPADARAHPPDLPPRSIPACPADPAPEPGAHVKDPATAGGGACAGKTLADAVAAVHALRPDLAYITRLALPDEANYDYILAHARTDGGFSLVFQHGEGDCPLGCTLHGYWYFDTGPACDLTEVGHYHPMFQSVDGGACVAQNGAPMWTHPPAPDPASVCGNDTTPAAMTGLYRVHARGERLPCDLSGGNDMPRAIDTDLDMGIEQNAADPTRGFVTFFGTGHPLVDGFALGATFTRQRFTVSKDESNLPSTCPQEHHVNGGYDFECRSTSALVITELGDPACQLCKGRMTLTLSPP